MEQSMLLFMFCFVVYHFDGKTAETILDDETVDPDSYRNVTELITSKGYPCEEHTVVTEDGYILSMQRIPHGKNNHTEPGDKEVVLLVHGELGDGKTWFLNPPGQGLGYILPDAGCDVWIINCRGSTYSKNHVKYPVRSKEFWNWSFDEVAHYDVTATIDYVLNATGKDALHVIGYSRGNTVVFILLSESQEYNHKVKLFSALAPVARIGHMKSIVRFAVPFAEAIAAGVNATTQGEFLPTNKLLRKIIAKFCKLQVVEFCENVIFAVGGQDRKNLNETRVPIYSAQYPSSTSAKILLHFAQLYRSKKFRKFDYGLLGNLDIYNQAGVYATTKGEFLLTNKALRKFIAKFCKLQVVEFCQNLLFAISGQDRKHLNETRVPIYSAQYPSSTSAKILVHFAQLYRSKKFRKYDYGLLGNLDIYNKLTPPAYQLSRITAPVVLFTSDNDIIANPTDVNWLRKQLRSVVYDYTDKEYNHFDFIWAKDVERRIYKTLLELHSQY